METRERRAACLCGAVRLRITGAPTITGLCHCIQCRRWTGHMLAAATWPKAAVTFEAGADAVRWYRHTPKADRGFCGTCGSILFWKPVEGDTIDLAMGSLDLPTGLGLDEQIHTASAGDYYAVDRSIPLTEDR